MAAVKFPKRLLVTEGDAGIFLSHETEFEAVHATGWGSSDKPVAVYELKEMRQMRFVVESSPAKPKRKR